VARQGGGGCEAVRRPCGCRRGGLLCDLAPPLMGVCGGACLWCACGVPVVCLWCARGVRRRRRDEARGPAAAHRCVSQAGAAASGGAGRPIEGISGRGSGAAIRIPRGCAWARACGGDRMLPSCVPVCPPPPVCPCCSFSELPIGCPAAFPGCGLCHPVLAGCRRRRPLRPGPCCAGSMSLSPHVCAVPLPDLCVTV